MDFNPFIFAAYGITIVFSGLAFLAFLISNIHYIFSFFGKKNLKKKIARIRNKKTPPLTNELKADTFKFILLTNNGNESFFLPELIDKGLKRGIENPWKLVDVLIKKNILKPDDTGKFMWNKESVCYKKININK